MSKLAEGGKKVRALLYLLGAVLALSSCALQETPQPVPTAAPPSPTAAPTLTPTPRVELQEAPEEKEAPPGDTAARLEPPLVELVEEAISSAALSYQSSFLTGWHQDAGSPQRTGYTPVQPELPWELAWTWNGPDDQGKPGEHFYDAPAEGRTITGGGYIFAPAGDRGLFAVDMETGREVWNFSDAAVLAAAAYDPASGMVFAGGADGVLYKIRAKDGSISGAYSSGSPVEKALLLSGEHVYAVNQAGELHKVIIPSMQAEWVYQGGAEAAAPPALSHQHGVVVFAAADLSIHAVDASTGEARWKVYPSANPPRYPYTFSGYWPVIAEQSGVVFVRLNLGMDGLWSGPGSGQKYPSTNEETRQYLQDNPELKNLFALDLLDGSEKFIPAVGFGGVETLTSDGKPELETGPVPVVRRLENGHEVAYLFFRSGQVPHLDGRWDSAVGEMVLDDVTIPGMKAGDLRFIRWSNSYTHITDEQGPLTMAGETLFHSHWGALEQTTLSDRGDEYGHTYDAPIPSRAGPPVIRRMQACPDFDPQTHWTTCGLTLYDDGRYWNGPGWWVYWDVLDPPTPSRRAYSEGILPRYAYVVDRYVVVQGNGGELLAFRHSGLD
jgi:outer membrane protein assembly factor BamB